ncbi:GntR family transcriptional regulator [Sodalis sp. C49]|uniref:GntR family transcriptional regulator n=1 Tax=Sodalis sp. C49 TaxID=3228929 RepID=UPI0039659AD6
MPGQERYSHQLLYATVRQRILDDIEQGVYRPNQQIPTENELCILYDVSRITIRKAITDLVKDGVLIRWQGKGTFVQSKKVENELLTVSGFTDFGVLQGKEPREEVVKRELIPAGDFSSRLEIDADSQIFKLVRVMYLEEEPLFIDYSYIPLARYPQFDQQYLPGTSTYHLLQERYQTQVVSDKKVIDIFHATKSEARRLQCELGEPLFRISKIAYDRQGRPVHCSDLFCRANRVRLTIDNHRKAQV